MKKLIKPIILVLVVYFVGVGLFSLFTYPKTFVHDKNKGFTLISKAFDRNSENRTLKLIGRNNKSDTLQGDKISYTESIKAGQKLNQNAFLWPVAIFQTHKYNPEYDIAFSEQQLEDFLVGSEIMKNAHAPTDAKLKLVDGKYTVEPSKPGDTLDKKLALKNIIQAFEKGDQEINLEDSYLKPAVSENDESLKNKLNEINQIMGLKITFTFGDDKEVLDGEKFLDLYKYVDGKYVPLKDQVHEYVRQLAIKYDTFGENVERKFNATGIGEITVKGGIYGWQIDVDKTTDALIASMQKFETKEMKPIYAIEGLKEGKNDLGNTYIEISLDRQHLWFYKNGELITETDLVSGDPNRGVATPKGVQKVWSREKDRSLVGIVPEGTADYSSAVDFWMPVTWSGVGIHNSRWRTSFGGNIYNGNGSFGCINLPYDPAKVIYDNVEINTPVVIY